MTPSGSVPIVSIVDEGLGHSSYVVGLGDGTALVVDPARFPDRATPRRGRAGLADRVDRRHPLPCRLHLRQPRAGGRRRRRSSRRRAPASRSRTDPSTPARPSTLAPGSTLRAIATPGHTPDHLAYLLLVDGTPEALFSGGSLMVGAVGRTDLLGDEHREDLARAMFRALPMRRSSRCPTTCAVYPTHGAGSFCSAPSGAARTTTIGTERATNPLLSIDDEDRFVATLLDGLGQLPDLLPAAARDQPARPPPLPRAPRPRPARPRHGPSSRRRRRRASSTPGRSPSSPPRTCPGRCRSSTGRVFASWFGWLVPIDRPVVFVLDEDTDRADLVRQCLAVGHDTLARRARRRHRRLDGGRAPGRVDPAGRPPTTSTGTVLDIRQDDEWDAGHVPGAIHVELGDLADRRRARRAADGDVRARRTRHERRQHPRRPPDTRDVAVLARRARGLARRHRHRPRRPRDHAHRRARRRRCGSGCGRTWRSSACSSRSTRWSAG